MIVTDVESQKDTKKKLKNVDEEYASEEKEKVIQHQTDLQHLSFMMCYRSTSFVMPSLFISGIDLSVGQQTVVGLPYTHIFS